MPRPKLSFIPGNGTNYPEWKETTIGQIGAFHYGKSAPKWSITLTAQTPCVRYGELYTHHKYQVKKIYSYTEIPHSKLVFSKGGEVLVPRVGEEPLDFHKCCFLPFANIAIGEMISIYETKQNGLFISYLFNATMKYEFAKRVEGGNVSNLYYDVLTNIPIRIPCLEEQQKIASFFATLDEKIELSERKLEALQQLKKGLMQKIFSNSIWGRVALKTVCQSFSGGTPSSKNKDFYVGDIPFIRSAEIHGNTTALFINQSALDKSSAKMVNKGDLLYALYGANSGDCDISKINGAINQAILCIRPLYENTVDVLFLKEQLYHRKGQIISTYLQGGQGNLSGSLVMNLSVMLPPYKEQVKISALFSLLNDKIDLNKQKISLLQQLKQGFMQQMFV